MPEVVYPSIFAPFPHLVVGFTTRAYDFGKRGPSGDPGRLMTAHGFAPDALATGHQVHEATVEPVSAPGHYPARDGQVTDQPGVVLGIFTADCAAVLLADPEARVLGACHSGWRGTVAAISREAVRQMEKLGAEPGRIRAWIGPCISAEGFEVGEEVAAQFDDAFVVRRPDWPRPHVDIKAAIRQQLESAGLEPYHIEVSDACTVAETDRFYSYRAEGGTPGRMLGFIGMRP